jgi:hypothetical protein
MMRSLCANRQTPEKHCHSLLLDRPPSFIRSLFLSPRRGSSWLLRFGFPYGNRILSSRAQSVFGPKKKNPARASKPKRGIFFLQWSQPGSNRRPLVCKAMSDQSKFRQETV